MRTKIALMTSLGALGALLPAAALAQTAEPAPVAAPAPPPTPAPAEAAPAPAPPAEQAPAAAMPEAPAGPAPVPAWFRIDSDGLGLQLWAGATHPLTDTIGLATDMYVGYYSGGSFGEFDIGPAITAGPVIITPMIGANLGWNTKRLEAIVPQLYVVGGPDPVYLELWVQDFLYMHDGENHDLYTRFFIDYKVSDYFAVGPQVEATFWLNNDRDTLGSLPVGVSIMLPNYGAAGTFLAFAGIETQEASQANDHKLAGRLTWVKNF